MVVLDRLTPQRRHIGCTPAMPSLFRFLFVVGILACIGYGLVFALAHFVQPKPRDMTVTIPQDKFFKTR